MTEKEIYDKLRESLCVINSEIYPETVSAIEEMTDDEGNLFEEPFDVACRLHCCDETEVMPRETASVVMQIYLDETVAGNPGAMTNLGSLYYGGRCGEQDYEKAVMYYVMADKHGDRQATENLGYCYYYGRTGEKDYKKAYHYFVKGALDGHLNSLYKIGDMYKNGYYVEKDENEAFCIYKHCYENMNNGCEQYIGADICRRMGDAYYYGTGTETDFERALEFYQKAERHFYQKIKSGDYFAKKGLDDVIEKQCIIRKKLIDELPNFDWTRKE